MGIYKKEKEKERVRLAGEAITEQRQEHREEERLLMEAGNAPKPCPRQLPLKPPRGAVLSSGNSSSA